MASDSLFDLAEEYEERRRAVHDEGRPKAVAAQRAKGQLTARERVGELVDRGSFQEFGTFAEPSTETLPTRHLVAPADAVIAGIGHIDARPVAVLSQDVTALGGSHGTVTGLKAQRMADLSRSHGLPLVMLLEGGGHRIQEAIDSRHQAGGPVNWASFYSLAQLSGWVPLVGAMMGPSFAGPSNFAALCDYVVMIRGKSTMGIAGPALVKQAIGEDVGADELGGPELHVDELGTADYGATSDEDAIASIRRFLSYLPSNARAGTPRTEYCVPAERDRERQLELDEIVPTKMNRAYDMRRVVQVLMDEGSVFEVRATYARNIITAFARVDGRPVGVIANNPMYFAGAMNVPSCEKQAHFVSMCDAFGVPMIFLVDTPGLMVGTGAERSGLVRRVARVFFELGQCTVPTLSVAIRKAYGAAYLVMAGGRSFAADLSVLWPTTEIGGMNVEGSVAVAYAREIGAHADPGARRDELIQMHKDRIGAAQAAGGFGVDEIIHPASTRDVLIAALERAPARTKAGAAPGRFHGISPI